jgi:ribosome-associated protein
MGASALHGDRSEARKGVKRMASKPSQDSIAPVMDSLEKTLLLVQLARSRKAKDLAVLDLRKLVSFADYFVICTARSDRQVQAIAEHLSAEMKLRKQRARSIEGLPTGRWVLIDYDDVLVHIFQKPVREFYDLEGLWSDAPKVPLPPDPEDRDAPEESEENG